MGAYNVRGCFFFFQAEDGIRDVAVTGVQTCALPISGIKDGTYVWIDRDMKAGVRLGPFEPAVPMPADVVAKFDGSSFIKVFDNGYAQLYWVVWGCATAC